MIDEKCFEECGLEQVLIPGSVKFIRKSAFTESSLRQVRFLGIAENGPHERHSSDNTEGSCLENK